jgi:dynein heavy chain, axonemal
VVELIRMWIHENKRVFGDRMISQEDRDTLDGLLLNEASNNFKLTRDQIYVTERILFADYINGIDGENRPYIWIQDLKDLVRKVEGYLEDYNSGVKNPMRLILFLDACDHVSRICRILRAPQGNAFLLGVGGSGRQSLAKLSSYISGQKCFQIEVVKGYAMTNWRDNLKSCLMQAGVEGKPTTFLFCDTQIINE